MSTITSKHGSAYTAHRDALRKWIMGFCVGLGGIIITGIINGKLNTNVAQSTLICIMIAAAAQILLAFICKFCMLSCDFVSDHDNITVDNFKEHKEEFPIPLYYFYYINNWLWIDAILDFISIVFLALSICYSFSIFANCQP